MRPNRQPLQYWATVSPEVDAFIKAEVEARGLTGRRGAEAGVVAELLHFAVRAKKAQEAPAARLLAQDTTPAPVVAPGPAQAAQEAGDDEGNADDFGFKLD